MSAPRDHIRRNRVAWQEFAARYAESGRNAWAAEDPYRGIWKLPESELKLLPDDLADKRCLEIGCGTACVSAWMARRGGHVVGIDPTPNQLATANDLRTRYGLPMSLIEGIGEQLPFGDNSFDFAISEYGAALWADPLRWVPEAARVLRPGSQLVFMTNASFAIACMPDAEDQKTTAALQRPYLGLYSVEWPEGDEVEFYLTHGQWIELLTDNGFVVERLLELGAPPGAETAYTWADAEWAQSWPSEEVWFARYQP
ncbi:MAG: class I SAM-dependent methyltransferase [Gammaproteobacteria bacterium]|nr:class I SAM-dependent methyltransferase [Gammaproteobacteria bacterium]MDE0225137.1 class I SAM-dependent methyltransferase [Gammaproteobacteria bacterium]